jgi:hypothetical protein
MQINSRKLSQTLELQVLWWSFQRGRAQGFNKTHVISGLQGEPAGMTESRLRQWLCNGIPKRDGRLSMIYFSGLGASSPTWTALVLICMPLDQQRRRHSQRWKIQLFPKLKEEQHGKVLR